MLAGSQIGDAQRLRVCAGGFELLLPDLQPKLLFNVNDLF